jgi:hypothetical protein
MCVKVLCSCSSMKLRPTSGGEGWAEGTRRPEPIRVTKSLALEPGPRWAMLKWGLALGCVGCPLRLDLAPRVAGCPSGDDWQ